MLLAKMTSIADFNGLNQGFILFTNAEKKKMAEKLNILSEYFSQ